MSFCNLPPEKGRKKEGRRAFNLLCGPKKNGGLEKGEEGKKEPQPSVVRYFFLAGTEGGRETATLTKGKEGKGGGAPLPCDRMRAWW